MHLGQGPVDGSGVVAAAAAEERFLVAEIATVRTAARDHHRIGTQVFVPIDQVAANGGRIGQAARRTDW